MIKAFIADESGAITVDWVVLTAAIVGLGVGVIAVFHTGTSNLASDVSDAVATVEIN